MTPDLLNGHWKLDLAISNFSDYAPRAWELSIQANPFGMSVEERLTQSDGTTLIVCFSPQFDGRDYPATGSPFFDAIAVTRPTANRLEVTAKKNGIVTIRDVTEADPDGEHLTVRYEIVAAEQVVVTGRAVFERARD